jgi:hypothetical protein
MGRPGSPGRRRGDHGVPRERRRRLRHRRAVPRRRRHDPRCERRSRRPGRRIRWTSGRWSLEVRGDELADVRCDGRVVLRAVRAVARDEDWGDGLAVRGDGRRGSRRAHPRPAHRRPRPRPRGHAARPGRQRRRLPTEPEGPPATASRSTSISRRSPTPRRTASASWCSIRPQLAGTALQVTHPDGSVSELAFPVQVSPHQPAQDIAGLRLGGRRRARCGSTSPGEVFEMEDQRNWDRRLAQDVLPAAGPAVPVLGGRRGACAPAARADCGRGGGRGSRAGGPPPRPRS